MSHRYHEVHQTHENHRTDCKIFWLDADGVIFASVSDGKLVADDMLDVDLVCKKIGHHAQTLANVEYIVQEVCGHAKAGDDVLILSNGGFEGIHKKLLKSLER